MRRFCYLTWQIRSAFCKKSQRGFIFCTSSPQKPGASSIPISAIESFRSSVLGDPLSLLRIRNSHPVISWSSYFTRIDYFRSASCLLRRAHYLLLMSCYFLANRLLFAYGMCCEFRDRASMHDLSMSRPRLRTPLLACDHTNQNQRYRVDGDSSRLVSSFLYEPISATFTAST